MEAPTKAQTEAVTRARAEVSMTSESTPQTKMKTKGIQMNTHILFPCQP